MNCQVECPRCGFIFEVKATQIGQLAFCQHCGERIKLVEKKTQTSNSNAQAPAEIGSPPRSVFQKPVKPRTIGFLALILLFGCCLWTQPFAWFKRGSSHMTQSVSYQVVESEDISVGSNRRHSAKIVMPSTSSPDEVKAALMQATKALSEEFPHQLIVVFAYRRMDDLRMGFTLGKSEYAPDGEWSQYGSGKPFKIKIEIRKNPHSILDGSTIETVDLF